MAGSRLDGAGMAKMSALEDAQSYLQRVHSLVEHMAIAERNGNPTGTYGQQIRRAAAPLVGLLKPQFGMIADLVSGLILVATRGGPEKAKVRTLREAVGQVRMHMEIAVAKVKEQHTITEEVE